MDRIKKEIRLRMLERRKSLSKEEVMKRSEGVIENLINLEGFRESKNIMFYVSYDNEVFTHQLIMESFSTKRVIVPLLKDDEILPIEIGSWEELERGAYGILEPPDKEPFPLDLIDIVLVPGIAFDEKGNRIGHGLGYYDKFLRRFNGIKIALAFDFQVLKEIPSLDHDKKVDLVVTERRTIKCD